LAYYGKENNIIQKQQQHQHMSHLNELFIHALQIHIKVEDPPPIIWC